jgi:predicted TIM-barrel fold metal-dependent hydrolase
MAFGPDRGMFERNFPPDGVSSSNAVLWNAFKRLAANFSVEEKAKLFSDTAKRTYRLAQVGLTSNNRHHRDVEARPRF